MAANIRIGLRKSPAQSVLLCDCQDWLCGRIGGQGHGSCISNMLPQGREIDRVSGARMPASLAWKMQTGSKSPPYAHARAYLPFSYRA